jgi:hypothetical protein
MYIINNKGLFTSCNLTTDVKPIQNISKYLYIVDIADLREDSTSYATKVSDIIKVVNEKGVYCPGYQEHVFFSDSEGNACVVETDNEKTSIIKDQENFLVATNFPLYNLKSLSDFENAPCERYKTAYTYIKDKTSAFSFKDAIEVLKKTVQATTIYSMVCDPKENVAYLFLDQDFSRVWKISFETKSISTFQGFKNSKDFKFDSQGIYFTALESYQEKDGNIKYTNSSSTKTIENITSITTSLSHTEWFSFLITIIVVLAIIVIVAIALSLINQNNRNKE